jgi:hypothetical protein
MGIPDMELKVLDMGANKSATEQDPWLIFTNSFLFMQAVLLVYLSEARALSSSEDLQRRLV